MNRCVDQRGERRRCRGLSAAELPVRIRLSARCETEHGRDRNQRDKSGGRRQHTANVVDP